MAIPFKNHEGAIVGAMLVVNPVVPSRIFGLADEELLKACMVPVLQVVNKEQRRKNSVTYVRSRREAQEARQVQTTLFASLISETDTQESCIRLVLYHCARGSGAEAAVFYQIDWNRQVFRRYRFG